MTVTKSKGGWWYLAIGVVSCCILSAVGAANAQDPAFGVLLALVGLVFYIGIFELAAVVKATASVPVIVAAGIGIAVCFVVLMAVSDSVIAGSFNPIPSRLKTAWLLPFGVALWTMREIWQRRRTPPPVSQ